MDAAYLLDVLQRHNEFGYVVIQFGIELRVVLSQPFPQLDEFLNCSKVSKILSEQLGQHTEDAASVIVITPMKATEQASMAGNKIVFADKITTLVPACIIERGLDCPLQRENRLVTVESVSHGGIYRLSAQGSSRNHERPRPDRRSFAA